MPKKLVSVKLDEHTLSILDTYQQQHGNCDRTKAITDIINAYPLLQVKGDQHDQAKRIKETLPKESVMPEVCTHIDNIDLNHDAVHCSLKRAWVKADRCQKCDQRTTTEDQQKIMVRCVNCKRLNQKDRFCAYYGSTMSEKTIKHDIPCAGYQKQ